MSLRKQEFSRRLTARQGIAQKVCASSSYVVSGLYAEADRDGLIDTDVSAEVQKPTSSMPFILTTVL